MKEYLYSGYISETWKIRSTVPSELLLPHYEKSTKLVKTGSSVTAALVGTASDGFFLKRYNYRSFWYSVRRVFMIPKAYRSLVFAGKLQEVGIATPEVLGAVCYVRRTGLPGQSFLITKQLAGNARSLDVLAAKLKDWSGFEAVAGQLVAMIVKLHENGLVHGDLSLRNIYCTENPGGEFSDFGLMDLDAMTMAKWGKVSCRKRTMEVARIVSSYCRCVRRHADIQLTELVGKFREIYEKESGCRLDGSLLYSRTVYLYNRKRRFSRR